MRIYLGNPAPADGDGERESVTFVETPDDIAPRELFASLDDLWASHGTEPPSWVACDDEGIADLLAKQHGCQTHYVEHAAALYAAAAGHGEAGQ